MPKITVYQFVKGDIRTGQDITSTQFASLETIASIKAEPIKETAIEIDGSSLDQ